MGHKRVAKIVTRTTIFARSVILIHVIKQFFHLSCVPVFSFGILTRTTNWYDHYNRFLVIIFHCNSNIFIGSDNLSKKDYFVTDTKRKASVEGIDIYFRVFIRKLFFLVSEISQRLVNNIWVIVWTIKCLLLFILSSVLLFISINDRKYSFMIYSWVKVLSIRDRACVNIRIDTGVNTK